MVAKLLPPGSKATPVELLTPLAPIALARLAGVTVSTSQSPLFSGVPESMTVATRCEASREIEALLGFNLTDTAPIGDSYE